MHQLKPLSGHPPAALHGLQAAIAALLRYQDMLPSDLYVKLDLLRDDVSAAISPRPRRSAVITPHSATPAITHPERHPR